MSLLEFSCLFFLFRISYATPKTCFSAGTSPHGQSPSFLQRTIYRTFSTIALFSCTPVAYVAFSIRFPSHKTTPYPRAIGRRFWGALCLCENCRITPSRRLIWERLSSAERSKASSRSSRSTSFLSLFTFFGSLIFRRSAALAFSVCILWRC